LYTVPKGTHEDSRYWNIEDGYRLLSVLFIYYITYMKCELNFI